MTRVLRAPRDAVVRRGPLERLAEVEGRVLVAAQLVALGQAHRARLAELEDRVGTLAVAAAERLIGTSAEARVDALRKGAADALRRHRGATWVRLRVHPEDRSALDDLALPLSEDADIDRGGVVVESDLGVVDARLGVRIAALRRALRRTR